MEDWEVRCERLLGRPRTEYERRFAEDPGILNSSEIWWRDRYDTLSKFGYNLRSRYHPDWTPPWNGTRRAYEDFEEGQRTHRVPIVDATRTADGSYVMLKKLDPIDGRGDMVEVEINRYLSSEPLASDKRNHTAQAIDIFRLPGEEHVHILVLPLLRPFDNPRFVTIGEAVAFFSQLFEGLQFLHEQKIAHRDCGHANIMMDAKPMYDRPWHPFELSKRRDWKGTAWHRTRTERSVKYYYIDYGLSERYDPEATGTWPPLVLPVDGVDKTVPEDQGDKYEIPCNPFATDIYYVGNLVREKFMKEYYGFGFVKELVNDMVQDDPSKRPEIDEVVSRFAKIRGSLCSWKLRSRATRRKEWKIDTLCQYPAYIIRTLRFVITRTPAIPDP